MQGSVFLGTKLAAAFLALIDRDEKAPAVLKNEWEVR